MNIYTIVLIIGASLYLIMMYNITIKTRKLLNRMNAHDNLFFGSRTNLKHLAETSTDQQDRIEAATILRFSSAARYIALSMFFIYLLLMLAGIKGED